LDQRDGKKQEGGETLANDDIHNVKCSAKTFWYYHLKEDEMGCA
jgi:hypothetical protein